MWTKLSPHCFAMGAHGHRKDSNCYCFPSFHVLSIATFSNQINPEIWRGILLWLKSHGALISLKLFGEWVEVSASSCHALKMYLSYVAEVLVRSSYPGQGLQWKLRCIWFSPEAEKLDEAVSPASLLQILRFVQQLWLCKQGSVRVKSTFLQRFCVPVSQLRDTKIPDNFISSGIHTPSKHSPGQVDVLFQFYGKSHSPCSEKGPELTCAWEQ